MIIWGGGDSSGTPLANGGLYDPSTDSWSSVSTTAAPTRRYEHSAVWTGSSMIVWGGWGFDGTTSTFLQSGGPLLPDDEQLDADLPRFRTECQSRGPRRVDGKRNDRLGRPVGVGLP